MQEQIAKAVLQYRLTHGVSQSQLAYMIGVHKNTITNIENMRCKNISVKTLYKLSTIINVDEFIYSC